MLEILLGWFVISIVLGLLVGRCISVMGTPSEDSEIPAALHSLHGSSSTENMVCLTMVEGCRYSTTNEPVVTGIGYPSRVGNH